ncbi:catechol dioxygenase-like protein [Rhizobium sp. ERR 1071]|nr:catechol dioxygenase-like protein [Rhizobium sp. ERR1071]
MEAIFFPTRTGHTCTDWRQEFILLSDVLGVSMLVDAINNRKPSGASESTVLGPFHAADAPELPMGANICLDQKGEDMVISGRTSIPMRCSVSRRACLPSSSSPKIPPAPKTWVSGARSGRSSTISCWRRSGSETEACRAKVCSGFATTTCTKSKA